MNRLLIFTFLTFFSFQLIGQDSIAPIKTELAFKGQLSAWGLLNGNNNYPLHLGARYIPQTNFEIQLPKQKLIDFEASTSLFTDAGIHFFDSTHIQTDAGLYRLWGRYSTQQLEIRFGLQKIDFGSAVMLRSLRWFDQVDNRDPLRLTSGVYGGLIRYYFLNNTNVWLWALYGNKNPKGMEFLKSNDRIPELGGRIQSPIPGGEGGISYHFRNADSRDLGGIVNPYSKIPENRIGIDAKWDWVVGIWLEAVWVNSAKDLGPFKNQEIFTAGMDYTFGIGSGLHITMEHMLAAFDQSAFQFSQTSNFTALSASYPIGMFDNLNVIVYYDWTNNNLYNFINWFKQFNNYSIYLMGYLNPKNNQLSFLGTSGENLFKGAGMQLMFVWNH